MPTLLLIRHGDNPYLKQRRLPGNLPDIHLNEHGREQAIELAKSLQAIPIKAIYSSPLERAMETAEPLAKKLGLDIQVRAAFSDTNVGDWTGLHMGKLRKLPLWKQLQEHPSLVRFPGGESFQEIQERLVKGVDQICEERKPKDHVAIFFHADPIKLMLAHFLGLPMDNFHKFEVSSASVSVVEVGKKGTWISGLNLRPPFLMKK